MTGGADRRRALVILGVGLVFVGLLAVVFVWGGYRVNFTRSAPLGLWRIAALTSQPVRRGARVFICPPSGLAANLGIDRGYLVRGRCPSGSGPLIKTVAAVAGQVIAIGDHVIIDGRSLPALIVQAQDADGRPLTPWTGGTVPEGYVFLHSGFPGSYDSRYFGPLPVTGILGFAREIFTVDP